MSRNVSPSHIDALISRSEEAVWHPFPGTTIVAWKLPSEYIIAEKSSCVDLSAFDREKGISICRTKLKTKVIELESYLYKAYYNISEREAKNGTL